MAAPEPALPRGVPSVAEALAHVGTTVAASSADVVAINLPVPVVGATELLRALPSSDAFLFGVQGQAQSAVGSVRRLLAQGEDPMASLRAWSDTVFEEVEVVPWPGRNPVPPRVHGGTAFATRGQAAPAEGWEGFGDGQFTLPRFTLTSDAGAALLTVVVDRHRDSLADLTDTLRRLLQHLRSPTHVLDARSVRVTTVEQLSRSVWREYIRHVLRAIERDGFVKLVAARRARIVGDRPFDDLAVFGRLLEAYPDCHLYLVRRGGRSFLGATPETLFSVRGHELHTHALAGSWVIPHGHDGAEEAEALLRSTKNTHEHEVVHRQIVDALTPYTTGIVSADRTTLRLRNLLHLETPVMATLHGDAHVIDVLHALHPTPAVGGLPKWPAVEWIRRHEPGHRGWYAGAVGWFDAAGDATFAVAIRCALLSGNEAWVYTGAGIVADSEPEAEYDETAVKQQPLFRALGVGG